MFQILSHINSVLRAITHKRKQQITLNILEIVATVDICHWYATDHQLTYIATKSFTLCFKLKHIKIGFPDFVLGKHIIPAVDKM